MKKKRPTISRAMNADERSMNAGERRQEELRLSIRVQQLRPAGRRACRSSAAEFLIPGIKLIPSQERG
jgi:hypothetical protein